MLGRLVGTQLIRPTCVMDKSRAVKITQTLLQKTTANGCTPSEAAMAAERGTAYMQQFGFTIEDAIRSGRPPVQVWAAHAVRPIRLRHCRWVGAG